MSQKSNQQIYSCNDYAFTHRKGQEGFSGRGKPPTVDEDLTTTGAIGFSILISSTFINFHQLSSIFVYLL